MHVCRHVRSAKGTLEIHRRRHFYPRDAMLVRVLAGYLKSRRAVHLLSDFRLKAALELTENVCPCVRVSVKCRYCIETAARIELVFRLRACLDMCYTVV